MRIKQHNRFPKHLAKCPKCLSNSLDIKKLDNGSVLHSCRVMNCCYLVIWKPHLFKLTRDENENTMLPET
jgi:hypothetical protein